MVNKRGGKKSEALAAQRIADWAASKTSADPPPAVVPAARHPGGRGSAMTAEEIEAVRFDFLTAGLSRVQLAEKHGRTRTTIARCLEGKDFDEMRRAVELEVREQIRIRMIRKADSAMQSWEDSLAPAAERGNHKPARDLMLHAGVIDPIESTESGPKVIVQIGVSAHEVKVGIGAASAFVNVGTDGAH